MQVDLRHALCFLYKSTQMSPAWVGVWRGVGGVWIPNALNNLIFIINKFSSV